MQKRRKGLEYLVSDHAVVRWLERVKGIDVAALREEILTHEAMAAIAVQDRSTVQEEIVQHGSQVKLVVRNARVVTVLGQDGEERTR
ncbi:MAG: hypothetical protein LAT50_19440 [Ectothiorhodospiraceae bacterium]|nr:hypothetical protein [Ectothiorhodospiraceae bacterium]